jgi:hypothetical protein
MQTSITKANVVHACLSPAFLCRAIADVSAALQQHQRALQAAYMKLNAEQMGLSARNVLYSGSVRVTACEAATAAAAADMPSLQPLEAVRFASTGYVMGKPGNSELDLQTSTAHVLLQPSVGSSSSSSSSSSERSSGHMQVVEAGAAFM